MKHQTSASIINSRLLSKYTAYLLPILAIVGGIALGNKSTKTSSETSAGSALRWSVTGLGTKDEIIQNQSQQNPLDSSEDHGDMVLMKGRGDSELGPVPKASEVETVSPESGQEDLETVRLTDLLNEPGDYDETPVALMPLPTRRKLTLRSVATSGLELLRSLRRIISGLKGYKRMFFLAMVGILVLALILSIFWRTGIFDVSYVSDVSSTQPDVVPTPDNALNTTGISDKHLELLNQQNITACKNYSDVPFFEGLNPGTSLYYIFSQEPYQTVLQELWPANMTATPAEKDALTAESLVRLLCTNELPELVKETAIETYETIREAMAKRNLLDGIQFDSELAMGYINKSDLAKS